MSFEPLYKYAHVGQTECSDTIFYVRHSWRDRMEVCPDCGRPVERMAPDSVSVMIPRRHQASMSKEEHEDTLALKDFTSRPCKAYGGKTTDQALKAGLAETYKR